MTRALSAFAFVAVFCLPASAAEQTFPLTGETAKITFTGKKKDGKHDGGFKTVTGTATVADANPATLKIDATIDCDSLYSDNDKLTAHLKAPDFFAVKDHPKATFKSTKVEKTAAGYTITGDLTLLGKTRPVTIPAAVAVTGDTLTIASDFSINRADWGMTYGKGMVDDVVVLKLNVNAKK